MYELYENMILRFNLRQHIFTTIYILITVDTNIDFTLVIHMIHTLYEVDILQYMLQKYDNRPTIRYQFSFPFHMSIIIHGSERFWFCT